MGEGSFPVACAEEPRANVPLLIFLAAALQPELHSKLQRYNPSHFPKSLQQEGRGNLVKTAMVGRWVREGD